MKVIVKSEHLEWVKEYIDEWLFLMQADKIEDRETLDLTNLEEEFTYVVSDESRREIFRLILQHGVIRNKQITGKLGISPGRVSQIIRELEEHNIVDRTGKGYVLTRLGNKIGQEFLARRKEIEQKTKVEPAECFFRKERGEEKNGRNN